ncbi:MAG: energy transducer TonB [Bacteroidota bacterium]
MKNIITKYFVLQILFCTFSSFFLKGYWHEVVAQEKPDKQNMQVTTNQEPFYPSGEQSLYTYIMYNVKYSEEAKKNFIEGNVTLSFDVVPDSSVTNIKIISDVGYGVGEEVKNLVQKLKFAPAIQMGIKVRMNLMMDFPIRAH